MSTPSKIFAHVPFHKDGDEYFLTGRQIVLDEDLWSFCMANSRDFRDDILPDVLIYIGSQDPDKLVYEISPNGVR